MGPTCVPHLIHSQVSPSRTRCLRGTLSPLPAPCTPQYPSTPPTPLRPGCLRSFVPIQQPNVCPRQMMSLCLSNRNQDCWTHKKIIKSLTVIECGGGGKHRAFPQPSQRPCWENEQFLKNLGQTGMDLDVFTSMGFYQKRTFFNLGFFTSTHSHVFGRQQVSPEAPFA